jgi:hypothetical protein
MGRGIHDETKRLIEAAYGILEAEWPMTVRQLFYRLVSIELIRNEQRAYKRVIDHVGQARERGEIPWEWIADRSRPVYSHSGWDGLAEYGETVAEAYRRDFWSQQPKCVFILAEKDTITGSIEPVAKKWGVTIYTLRGFASKTRAHDIGVACSDALRDKKEVTILYLGDWDPSGVDIQRDVGKRIESGMVADYRARISPYTVDAWSLRQGSVYGRLPKPGWELMTKFRARAERIAERWLAAHPDADATEDECDESKIEFRLACRYLKLDPKTAGLLFIMRRLAILPEDIREFRLPPLRVKNTDSRTPGFVLAHGPDCIELDALPPKELRRRLDKAIKALVDMESWNKLVDVEKAERDFTKRVMSQFKGMQGSEAKPGGE